MPNTRQPAAPGTRPDDSRQDSPRAINILFVRDSHACDLNVRAALPEGITLSLAMVDEFPETPAGSTYDGVLLFVSDLEKLPESTLRRVRCTAPLAPTVLIVHNHLQTLKVIQLIRSGFHAVFDNNSPTYIDQALRELATVAHRCLAADRSFDRGSGLAPLSQIVGQSESAKELRRHLVEFAKASSPVLIGGETGTGKGLAANVLHQLSPRACEPFVTVDCGCLPSDLIEAELFGSLSGAYTGASHTRVGLVGEAQGGTLFLDEVGELPLTSQTRLLRLLSDRTFRQVGSSKTRIADIRVIAATNRDLTDLVRKGLFREDLLHRLNALTLDLPPLRQRAEDIPNLAVELYERLPGERPSRPLSSRVMSVLQSYSWPGNIRELQNVLSAAFVSSGSRPVDLHHLPLRILDATDCKHEANSEQRGRLNLKSLEQQAIGEALRVANGDKKLAAQLLGIGKTTVYRRLQQMEDQGSPILLDLPPLTIPAVAM